MPDVKMKKYPVMKDKFAYTGKTDTREDGDSVGKYFGEEALLRPKNSVKRSGTGPNANGYGYPGR